jgi:DNA-directed RNA polymerase specialized sigma24 family protein
VPGVPRGAPSLDNPPWAQSPAAGLSDGELLTQLDDLVISATRGDRQAIGAIALSFTRDLLAAANEVLDNEHDAADVVQDLFLALLEGEIECLSPPRGRAMAFLLGVVQDRARRHLAERALA